MMRNNNNYCVHVSALQFFFLRSVRPLVLLCPRTRFPVGVKCVAIGSFTPDHRQARDNVVVR